MKGLSRRIIFDTLRNPVYPGTSFRFPETLCFVVCIAKLAAGEVDDFEGKVVSNSVNMMRQLFRVSVHLILWFRLHCC